MSASKLHCGRLQKIYCKIATRSPATGPPARSEKTHSGESRGYRQEQVPAQGLLFWQEKLIWLLPQ